MSSCCRPEGYAAFFSKKSARRALDRYRRRGLDKLSQRIVDTVRARGIENATVLEVGGGIGAVDVELIQSGAAKATVIELSPEYEDAAAELLRDRGLGERVERRIGDFAADPTAPTADAVILNRVVCCYPDYESLLGAAADRAQRMLVFSFPRRRLFVRVAFALMNAWLRIRRSDFRGYVHPPSKMLDVGERHGLTTTARKLGVFWEIAALERAV
jgi:Methyltransferase domain